MFFTGLQKHASTSVRIRHMINLKSKYKLIAPVPELMTLEAEINRKYLVHYINKFLTERVKTSGFPKTNKLKSLRKWQRGGSLNLQTREIWRFNNFTYTGSLLSRGLMVTGSVCTLMCPEVQCPWLRTVSSPLPTHTYMERVDHGTGALKKQLYFHCSAVLWGAHCKFTVFCVYSWQDVEGIRQENILRIPIKKYFWLCMKSLLKWIHLPPAWSLHSAPIHGVFVWLLGAPLGTPEWGGLCLPFTNLNGLSIPGSNDISRLVGLTTRHVFTKRGQTYWGKNKWRNMECAGSKYATHRRDALAGHRRHAMPLLNFVIHLQPLL